MTTIMQALRLEHANIARLLTLLEQQMHKGAEADLDLVKAITDYLLTYPDQYHHPKEDLVYRALLEVEPETGAALDDLEAEHIELAERTKDLSLSLERILSDREAPGPWFEEIANNFIGFYRQHMTKEESNFFSEAERVLSYDTFDELESQVTAAADPLFDERAADRLSRLRTSLVSPR